jgi:hypothetical protein
MALIENSTLKALALDLTSLSDLPPGIVSAASSVKEANFSFNAIAADTLGALAPFAKLEVLVLDNNDLSSLSALPSLPVLKTLWLNNNALDDLEELLNVLSRQCPQLEYLSLLRNPCCPNELIGKQETEYRRYRLYTKFRLPVLKNLDATKFSDAEATEAREKGKFLRSAAPEKHNQVAAGSLPSSAPNDDIDMFEVQHRLRSSATNLFKVSFASGANSAAGGSTTHLLADHQSDVGSSSTMFRSSIRQSATLDFSGRTNSLCAALLEECAVAADDVDDASDEMPHDRDESNPLSQCSTPAIFSEQKVMPSTALCVGNRFITDDLL